MVRAVSHRDSCMVEVERVQVNPRHPSAIERANFVDMVT
jgi:hypothetical protein